MKTLRLIAGALLGVGLAAPAAAQPDEAEGEAGAAPTSEPAPAPVAEPAPSDAEPSSEPDADKPEPSEKATKAAALRAKASRARAARAAKEPETAAASSGAPAAHHGSFAFGTYGRVMAGSDVRGRPARNADIVLWGSRLDHGSYVELELRREDHWDGIGADSRVVATLALAHPLFHWDGDFDASIAVRNLYIEEKHLALKGLGLWVGSRMLRGDDIYLLDVWPLDNLNTVGAGVRYDAPTDTSAQLHFGIAQPNNGFFVQEAQRPEPLNQFGAASVRVLDRLRYVGSAKLEQLVLIGEQGAGLKLGGYGEVHQVPRGQRETAQGSVFEDVPHENGWVVGGQIGGFTGERNTHVNLFVRYARGIAAYGEFESPSGFAVDRSVNDAREVRLAVGGNFEVGPFGLLLGGYLRAFRNASPSLDHGDLDEGIVIARPQVFFTDWLGLAVEGSFQVQQRGVLVDEAGEQGDIGDADPQPLFARVGRVGVLPFVTLAGRGSFSRPMFWISYLATARDADARALYPMDDVYRARKVDHFIGIGAEWWFGSTSYGGTGP